MSIRVALVDDHALFREGLKELLSRQPGMEVVGEAADARTAYAVVEQSRPDLVLLDVALEGSTGFAAARELSRRFPATRILFISAHATEDYVAQALRAGGSGYALKDQGIESVVEAILAVSRGQTYLAPRIGRFVLEEHLQQPRAAPVTGPLEALSPREREIFDLLVAGTTNPVIAEQLSISVKTVETHRARVLKKLHVHSMSELIRFAARHRLLLE